MAPAPVVVPVKNSPLEESPLGGGGNASTPSRNRATPQEGNNSSVTIINSTTLSDAALTSALERILNNPNIASKLKGPKGDTGQSGPQSFTTVQSSSPNPVAYMPVGITYPDPSHNFTGGEYASIANLSSNLFTNNVSNITTLNVKGDSTLTGSLSVGGGLNVTGTISGNVSGAINPNLTLGSVTFQGATGLTEDNANLFYDAVNHRLGIGTATPTQTLDVNGNITVHSNIYNTDYITKTPEKNNWINTLPLASTWTDAGYSAIPDPTVPSGHQPQIIKKDGVYYVFIEYLKGSIAQNEWLIGVYYSSSLSGPWTFVSNIIPVSTHAGDPDDRYVADPSVLYVPWAEHKWQMWFDMYSSHLAGSDYWTALSIGHAYADNPLGPWTKQQTNGITDIVIGPNFSKFNGFNQGAHAPECFMNAGSVNCLFAVMGTGHTTFDTMLAIANDSQGFGTSFEQWGPVTTDNTIATGDAYRLQSTFAYQSVLYAIIENTTYDKYYWVSSTDGGKSWMQLGEAAYPFHSFLVEGSKIYGITQSHYDGSNGLTFPMKFYYLDLENINGYAPMSADVIGTKTNLPLISNVYNGYYIQGDTNLYRFAANTWRTSGSMIVDSNIGIGTTTPLAKLQIAAGTTATNTAPLMFTFSGAALNTTPQTGAMETDSTGNLYFTNSTPTRNLIPMATAANTLFFTTTAGTSVTLPTSGTLVSSVTTGNGISATNTAGALAFTLGAITPSSVNSVTLSGSATPALSVTGTSSISGSNTGDNATNSSTMYIGTTSQALNRASAAEGLAGITSLTPGANFTLSQNSVNVLTSESASAVVNTLYLKQGKVGIGTTGPLSKLSIQGSDTSSSNSGLNVTDSTGASMLFVRNDGRVGIGTTTPAFAMDMTQNVTGGPIFQIRSTNTAGSPTMYIQNDGSNYMAIVEYGSTVAGNLFGTTKSNKAMLFFSGSDTIIGTYTNNNLLFGTNNLERVRIQNDGNVGINTTAPGSLLDIKNGSLRLTASDGHYVGFHTAAGTTNKDYRLPLADGTNAQVLQTDGAGNLSWTTAGGAGGTGLLSFNGSTATAQTLVAGSLVSIADSGTNNAVHTISFNPSAVFNLGAVSPGTTGMLTLTGATSGVVGLSVADAAGTWTMKLPTTAGTANYPLITDGSGNTSWSILPLSGGGTAATLTAINGGIVYSGASAMAISAAGTSGQVLISGGAGAPTWTSTPLATSLALGGATIGTNALAVTGTAIISSNVGIGSTTPLSLLDVQGSSNGTDSTIFVGARSISLINTDTTAGNMSGFDFRTNDANALLTTGAKIMGVYTAHTANAVSGDLAFLTRNVGTITEKMRILANGNVGIGTTSPGYALTIGGTGQIALPNGINSAASITFPTNNVGIYSGSSGILNFASGSVAIAGFTSSGVNTVGYGIQNVTAAQAGGINLGAVGNISFSSSTSSVPLQTNDINLSRGAAGKLYVGNGTVGDYSGTLIAGNVGINTTTPTNGKLVVIGGVTIGADATNNEFSNASTGSGTTQMYIGNNTINVTAPSDFRTKENIVPTGYGLADLMKLNVVNFNYKKSIVDEGATQLLHTGMIAQEVQPIYPEAVYQRTDGFFAIDYTKLNPLIIKSIQDMNLNLDAIAGTVTPISGSANETFVTAFFNNVYEKITTWLADATNGIAKIFVGEINAKDANINNIKADTLCLGSTCVTEDQLKSLLSGASPVTGQAGGSVSAPAPIQTPIPVPDPVLSPISTPTPDITPVSTPPTLTPDITDTTSNPPATDATSSTQ